MNENDPALSKLQGPVGVFLHPFMINSNNRGKKSGVHYKVTYIRKQHTSEAIVANGTDWNTALQRMLSFKLSNKDLPQYAW
jgi:hypothetical protein